MTTPKSPSEIGEYISKDCYSQYPELVNTYLRTKIYQDVKEAIQAERSRVEELETKLNQMEKIVSGIDVENPDAVDTLIDAIRIQKENYTKIRQELLSGIKVAVEALEEVWENRLLDTGECGLCGSDNLLLDHLSRDREPYSLHSHSCPLNKSELALTTLNNLVEKYK